MNYQHNIHRLVGIIVVVMPLSVLAIIGCAPQMQESLKICPGMATVPQSLSLLKSHSEKMTPLKANGRCRSQFFADGKKYDESFNIKLWVNPPDEIYMQGDIFFNPKGIILGSNKGQFWMLIKPELSRYTWGNWFEQNSPEELVINPKTLLEALGFTDLSSEDNWSLYNEGAFDVLRKQEKNGTIKKVYVSSCDYRVRKIEYSDMSSRVVAVVEMNKYKQVAEGLFVPTVIKIFSNAADNPDDEVTVTFNLNSIRPTSFTAQQLNRLFVRPQPRGFMHVFRSINGEMIKQQ